MRAKLLVATMCLAVSACGKKSGGGSDEKGNGPGENDGGEDAGTPSGTLAISAQLPATADASVALLLNVSGPTVSSFAEAKSAPISPTGTLAISLDAKEVAALTEGEGEGVANGIVIMTVKESDDKFAAGASMKFIEVPAVGDSDLVKLPTDLITETSEVALGELSDSDGSFVASAVSGADLIKTDAKVLAELASTDNGLKLVRNRYMNGDLGAEKYLEINPQYTFDGDITPFLTATDFLPIVVNGTSKNARLRGFNLRFEGKMPDLTIADVCKATSGGAAAAKDIVLVPPTADLAGNAQTPELTFFSDACEADANACEKKTILSSAGSVKGSATNCKTDNNVAGSNFFDFEEQTRGGSDAKYVNFNWGGGGGFVGAIPAGLWDMKLKEGATETLIGRFDIGSAYPMSSQEADAYPVVYMPSVKITRDGSNKLTGLELKFMVWNQTTSAYEEVTDLTLFKSIVQELNMRMEDHSTDGWTDPNKDGITVAITPPATGHVFTADLSKMGRDWILNDSGTNVDNDETTPHAESFVVVYTMYGVNYRFDLRP